MTPEGRIKKVVTECLVAHGVFPASKAGAFPPDAEGWFFLPVSNGMGVSGIPDFMGHHRGRCFGVETKAPGKKPTQFQAMQHAALRLSGAKVFVIDGDLTELETWLSETQGHCPLCGSEYDYC